MLNKTKEKRYVLGIYSLSIITILSKPLMNVFFRTNVYLWINLICYFIIAYYFYRLYSNHSLCKLTAKLWGGLIVSIASMLWRAEWPTDIQYLIFSIITADGVINYIQPLLFLFLPAIKYKKDILRIFFFGAIMTIPLWIFSPEPLVQDSYKGEFIGIFLPFFAAFLLGLPQYFSKKQFLLIIIIWLVYTILMLLNARRNVSFSLIIYAMIAYIIVNLINIKKHFTRFVFSVLIIIIAGTVVSVYWDSLKSDTFNRISNRINDNTRDVPNELFWLDFSQSSIDEWIIGRGMQGGYYQVIKDEKTGEISDNRQIIETGYLFLLMKGGLLYVIMIVYLMIMAIKRGFKAKEFDNKYIALILCTYFIDFYTTSPLQYFGVRSLLFWFMINYLLTDRKQNNIQTITR